MKENHDQHQIVMSREAFGQLLQLAEAGEQLYSGPIKLSKVLWHVRKYNSVFKIEQKNDREHREQLAKERRHKAKRLINTSPRQVVYLIASEDTCTQGVVMGRSRAGKECVRVRGFHPGSGKVEDFAVHVDYILTEIPDDYVFVLDRWYKRKG